MSVTDDDRRASRADAEARVDTILLQSFGRTFRLDDDDLRRAAQLAAQGPSAVPPDPAPPPDSVARITGDFPQLFGA